MQLAKWFFVPVLVLAVAVTLSITECFDGMWVSIAFALLGLVAMSLWRRATYRLSGSIKNLDHEHLEPQSLRIFKTIFVITFGLSFLLMLGALFAMLVVPAVRTSSGSGLVFIVIVWSSFVQFGALNVLTHHLIPKNRST